MQNVATVRLTECELATIDEALAMLKRVFEQRFTALPPEQLRALYKMGDRSEGFCRQTLTLLASNPQIVPPTIDVPDAQGDLAAIDALRPRLQQLRQLVERGEDTTTALGSDVLSCALAGYALLKVAGRNEGLRNARRELGSRFARPTRRPAAVPAA